MKFNIILLDLDGTIFDFEKSEYYALNKCFADKGIKLTEEIYSLYKKINNDLWVKFENNTLPKDKMLSYRFEILFLKMGYEFDTKEISEQYQNYLADSCELVDYASEVLSYLSIKYKLYVVSNGQVKTQMSRLKKANLEMFFTDFFISEQLGVQKPNKIFFDLCYKIIKEKPEKSIIVGDSLTSDILGGNNAGIKTCWYNPNKLKNNEHVKIDYEIRSLLDLKTFL